MEQMEAIDQAWLSLSRISFRWAAFFSFRLSRPSLQRLFLILNPLLVAGCATATVTPSLQPTGALPPPEMVWVYDFTITPNEVDLDSGQTNLSILILLQTDPSVLQSASRKSSIPRPFHRRPEPSGVLDVAKTNTVAQTVTPVR